MQQMKVVKKLPTEGKPDGSAYATPLLRPFISIARRACRSMIPLLYGDALFIAVRNRYSEKNERPAITDRTIRRLLEYM